MRDDGLPTNPAKNYLQSLLIALLCVLVTSTGSAEWETLRDCRLLPNEFNDGDSFHVEHDGKEYIFRLYFVDAPETDLSFPERVADQGAHFGISTEQALMAGKNAAEAMKRALSRKFRVYTRFQGAKGRSELPRYFAFVATGDGKDLAALLVANGFARVFGVKAVSPDGNSASEMVSHYKDLEQQAKRKRLGAYGRTSSTRMADPALASSAPLTTRAAPVVADRDRPSIPVEEMIEKRTSRLTADKSALNVLPKVEFKDGDHSEIPGWKRPAKKAEPKTGLISLNSSTTEELQELPGIGPHLAQAIVARRPFSSVADLRSVPGIGPKKYAEVMPLVSP